MVREFIKPLSPTPSHFQTHQFSLLDQTSPPHYNGLILFFESTNLSKYEISNMLKASLSEVLTCYYPLAGRLVNNTSINCNDVGTPYTEACTRSLLSEVIQEINNGQNEKFLPRAADDFDDNVVLAVQVNFFDCGGVAIGASFSHKLADAFLIIMFLNSWAATCRGESKIDGPLFELAKLFPSSDKLKFLPRRPELEIKKETIITKMFTFNSSILETLRKKFSKEEDQLRATRVEALSTFIWQKYMTLIMTNANLSQEKLYCMRTAVTLRNRATLDSSPEGNNFSSGFHFGNCYTFAVAMPSVDDKGTDLVKQMRVATKNIDGEFVKMLQEGDKYVNFLYATFEKAAKGEMVSFSFSSWCKLEAYEADFGWGKPTRLGLGGMPLKNFARFIDTKNGDGVEAWISMEEEEMNKLEADQEFISLCVN